MEATNRIKEATFDINMIGLYDAEERRRQDDAMYLAYREKIATKRGYRNGRKAGLQQGKLEGIEQGKLEGIEQGKNSIINAMLSNGVSYDDIIQMTGIPKQAIKK